MILMEIEQIIIIIKTHYQKIAGSIRLMIKNNKIRITTGNMGTAKVNRDVFQISLLIGKYFFWNDKRS